MRDRYFVGARLCSTPKGRLGVESRHSPKSARYESKGRVQDLIKTTFANNLARSIWPTINQKQRDASIVPVKECGQNTRCTAVYDLPLRRHSHFNVSGLTVV